LLVENKNVNHSSKKKEKVQTVDEEYFLFYSNALDVAEVLTDYFSQ